MKYGFLDGRFYIDIIGCSRQHGTMREESDRRAMELASTSNNLLLSLSSGVDSQATLHSFYTQGIPIDTVFMYLPGYNDIEYENLKIVAKKYQITPTIIDINPDNLRSKIIEESLATDIHPYSILWKHFLTKIPEHLDFVQVSHDPYVHFSSLGGDPVRYFLGLHLPEIDRERAFNLVPRSGKFIHYGDTPEFLLSILEDSSFRAVINSYQYYANNRCHKPGTHLTTTDRWDYYSKPFLYGKYWKDELIYFSKFVGYENIDYLQMGRPGFFFERSTLPPLKEILRALKSDPGGARNRYYEVDRPKKDL